MPTYEYACTSCGTHVEVYQRFTEGPLTECGLCRGTLRKVFHPAGILFKGSGFYATDSRRSARSGNGEKTPEGAAAPAASSSTSASDGSAPKEPSKEPSKEGASTRSSSGGGSPSRGSKERSA
jgi:putative FmdB family regulatory protein